MKPKKKSFKVNVYTTDVRIEGLVWVTMPPDREYIRLSDVLKSAADRGEGNFIIIVNGTVFDIKTNEIIDTEIPVMAVNKNFVTRIIPEKGLETGFDAEEKVVKID